MSEENQATEAGTPQKKKKINRLSAEEIAKKISAFEDAQHTKSVYYKHLVQRKKEMEKPSL
ncbi:MAG TPA: hypothetical protein PKX12_07070 [Spirochaetota bacterium]|nr:hypothetical protein [Spirochaetota bacterium]